ncbi:MAG: ABC transporter ATP-binding protein [Ardenticatenaceae bacterium]|nr:ABC transporter ATP-binding protein [Ardenticatenaceae bacterium]
MTAPIIQLKGVSKSYQSATGVNPVLQDVNLTVKPGQKVSLVGPSGSGKSTLLSLIAGLLRPDGGTVELEGTALHDLSDEARAELRAQRIGIALQSENLIPFLTALENVELALGFGGQRVRSSQARELLKRMGVAHRASHLPRQISGGEAQRVSLAVALANKPRLLLADEMVAQLDATTAESVVGDVFHSDMAVIFVTHDLALADQADVRLKLHNRQVVAR